MRFTPAGCDDPLAIIDVKEQTRCIHEVLSVLTPEERQAIEAAFFSELTYQEVATRLQQHSAP